MSYAYGKASQAKLATCDDSLRAVAELALEQSPYDITIVWGWRGEEIQNALHASGASHKRWPESMHNAMKEQPNSSPPTRVPWSRALDFAPWVNGKIPWKDTHVFAIIAGCFHAAAEQRGVTLRYGGDWDSDGSTTDQTLMDWGHIELVD